MSERTNSPHCKGNVQPTHYTKLTQTKVYTLSLNPAPPPHPETKGQVKVDKRCLWIFWVTHGNRCLHSPCNYLLTDLIQAVKWLAKSMCTQTGPESKVVHTIYLPAPSHTWCRAIAKADRKRLSLTLQGLNNTNMLAYTQKTFCLKFKMYHQYIKCCSNRLLVAQLTELSS